MISLQFDIVKNCIDTKDYTTLTEYAKINFDKDLIIKECNVDNVRIYTDEKNVVNVLCPTKMTSIQESSLTTALATGALFDDAESIDNTAKYIDMTTMPNNAIINKGLIPPKKIKIGISAAVGGMKDDGSFKPNEVDITNGIHLVNDIMNHKVTDNKPSDIVKDYIGAEDHKLNNPKMNLELHDLDDEIDDIEDISIDDEINDDDWDDLFKDYDENENDDDEMIEEFHQFIFEYLDNDDSDLNNDIFDLFQEGEIWDKAIAKGTKENIIKKILWFIPRLVKAILEKIKNIKEKNKKIEKTLSDISYKEFDKPIEIETNINIKEISKHIEEFKRIIHNIEVQFEEYFDKYNNNTFTYDPTRYDWIKNDINGMGIFSNEYILKFTNTDDLSDIYEYIKNFNESIQDVEQILSDIDKKYVDINEIDGMIVSNVAIYELYSKSLGQIYSKYISEIDNVSKEILLTLTRETQKSTDEFINLTKESYIDDEVLYDPQMIIEEYNPKLRGKTFGIGFGIGTGGGLIATLIGGLAIGFDSPLLSSLVGGTADSFLITAVVIKKLIENNNIKNNKVEAILYDSAKVLDIINTSSTVEQLKKNKFKKYIKYLKATIKICIKDNAEFTNEQKEALDDALNKITIVLKVPEKDKSIQTSDVDNIKQLILSLNNLIESFSSKESIKKAIDETKNEKIKQESFEVEGFLTKKPKKLKQIPIRDIVSYITVELNAIRDTNDQAMLSAYTCSKLELIDFYIACIDTNDERYIVPHTRQYLVDGQTQLNNLLTRILQIIPVNKNDRVWKVNVNYPEGWKQ